MENDDSRQIIFHCETSCLIEVALEHTVHLLWGENNLTYPEISFRSIKQGLGVVTDQR
jgi:hypothetical protein